MASGSPAHLLEQALQRIGRRKPLHFGGLGGAGKAWLAARLAERLRAGVEAAPLVVVTESYEGAEKLHRDIAFFGRAGEVRFFPHWDTLPFDSFSPQTEVIAQRFEALGSLLDGECPVLVTTPQALMQAMIPPEVLLGLRFAMAVGEEHPRRELLERLVAAGYARVDLVEAPGEFSSRGEIVDLFPVHLEQPVRLDFFDDEIESLRAFDVETQKSTGEVEAVTVYPAGEVVVNEHTVRTALGRLPHHKARVQPDTYRQVRAYLERGTPFPGCEQLMPLFYDRVAWLAEALPAQSVVLLDGPGRLEQRAREAHAEVLQEYELCLQQGNLALPPEQLYLPPQALQQLLARFRTVPAHELRLEGEPDALVFPFADNQALRSIASGPSPSAHDAAGGVVAHLRTWRDGGAPVYLAARSRTGAERLRHLLAEFELGAVVEEGPTGPALEAGALSGEAEPGDTVPEVRILTATPHQGFRTVDDEGRTRFALVTEAEMLGEKTRQRRLNKSKLQHFVSSLGELAEGDAVVHVEYGVGLYEGLKRMQAGAVEGDFLVLRYGGGDKVYVPVDRFHQVQRYTGLEGRRPALNRLGDGAWQKAKQKAYRQVEDMARELVELYARRKARPGTAFEVDETLLTEFEEAFPFQETEDQQRAIEEVTADMRGDMPMDRLVCGDVGFGKTEVAMRAAFMAVLGGRQALVLVPTTILAQQHYETFRERLQGFAVSVEAISRFRSPAEQRGILKAYREGELDILIGTHRLLSRDIQPRSLGLLVIDEEQRFGVRHKERIKQLRTQVDVLTLSATPIPRTLHMSLMGVRDLSIINTPPMDRIAIRTRLAKANDYIIREAVMREVRRGGQVFVVHNRVEQIHAYGNYLRSILPDVRMAVAHGQMSERQLEEVMLRFVEGETDVLLSTSIIESGLDIPRANTIIINNADRFGLAQLYQMRGRVGRRNVQAYAYLLVSPEKVLTEVAQKRLSLLQELNDLGSGFRIASHDLEIRGAGNLLGREQSGNINAVGLELYTRMVEDKIAELKGEEPETLEPAEFRLDLGFSRLLPETYIESTRQRLDTYKRLADVRQEAELWEIREALEDRYGPVPAEVERLLTLIRVRLAARRYGLSALERARGELVAEFGQAHRIDVERLMGLVAQPGSEVRLLSDTRVSLGPLPEHPEGVLERLRVLDQVLLEQAA